jgi:hypothetical protein
MGAASTSSTTTSSASTCDRCTSSLRSTALSPELTFLIYNGQSDANVPYNGQVDYWVPPNATVANEWSAWSVGTAKRAPTAGYVRTYETSSRGFRFAVVSGAGHEVPTYRPEAALSMLKQFLFLLEGIPE